MKKILFVLGLLSLVSGLQAVGHIGRLRAALKNNRSGYVFVVAHRGDWRNAPENSVSAIKKAADMGADMVEIDIQRTKDSVFILMHDGSIDRMTNGKSFVCGAQTAVFQTRPYPLWKRRWRLVAAVCL